MKLTLEQFTEIINNYVEFNKKMDIITECLHGDTGIFGITIHENVNDSCIKMVSMLTNVSDENVCWIFNDFLYYGYVDYYDENKKKVRLGSVEEIYNFMNSKYLQGVFNDK